MSETELKIIGRLLKIASDKFDNHGSNDLPNDFFEGLGYSGLAKLEDEYWQWLDPDSGNSGLNVPDNFLMEFFSEKILGK